MKIAYVLLIFGTFTINITALIAYLIFFITYRGIYQNISKGIIKTALVAPCPNCSSEIPIESQICKFCGARFEKKISDELDRSLDFNVSEPEYKLKQAYLPIQGLSKEEKKKFYYIIGFIIVSIIIGLLLVLFF